MTPRVALARGIGDMALALPPRASDQLLEYLELIAKWNRTYNLTSIRDPLRMVSHHLLDSLAVLPHLPMVEGASLADVGSGAGLPGVAIAIGRPGWNITLNDSSEKKTAFLRQVAIELKLRNVSVHAGRVEAWQPQAPFAIVISRAFAELQRFIVSCRHLLAPSGLLAAMKGAYPHSELAHLPADCECGEVIAIRVPLLQGERHLVLCRVTRSK